MTNTIGVQNLLDFTTVAPGELRIITSDIAVRPMSFIRDGERQGFEPALTRIVCDRLGLTAQWFSLPLKRFYPALTSGDYDVIWFNQVITQERRAWADFTRPYGRFDTAILVREDAEIESKAHLSGKRIGVLQESVSTRLLEVLPSDIEPVYFEGSHRVEVEMLRALRKGQIDAIIEDSIVLMAAEAQGAGVRVAFEIPSQHPFGVGVLPGNRELLEALNTILTTLIVDGTLNRLWAQWIPFKPYPF
ncbi:MAG: amino acid ABC transporter substrate-binding protein [Leptolyngbya sp. SIOISBB]|nr:amino acid ABC transporter substrate-binding protein [Leptolyngbya sp. SIOISBB]